jgi:hypothetical protein
LRLISDDRIQTHNLDDPDLAPIWRAIGRE